MTEEINTILSNLIGLPLTQTTRAVDMECLLFGTVDRTPKSQLSNRIGAFALHLQCPWRLTNAREIIVGDGDLYQQADETAAYEEHYDYFECNANLRDVKLNQLIKDKTLIIVSAEVDNFGGLEICFSHSITLTVFPQIASKADNEYWRLIDFRGKKTIHLESWSTGYAIGS